MFRRSSRNRDGLNHLTPNRKQLQLCSQVYEALSWVLGSVSHDDILPVCSIATVEPLPGNNRMLVKVNVPPDIPLSAATSALERAAHALRREVAQAITRRKAPELVFLPLRIV
jgi:ribosome-binding factor A